MVINCNESVQSVSSFSSEFSSVKVKFQVTIGHTILFRQLVYQTHTLSSSICCIRNPIPSALLAWSDPMPSLRLDLNLSSCTSCFPISSHVSDIVSIAQDNNVWIQLIFFAKLSQDQSCCNFHNGLVFICGVHISEIIKMRCCESPSSTTPAELTPIKKSR